MKCELSFYTDHLQKNTVLLRFLIVTTETDQRATKSIQKQNILKGQCDEFLLLRNRVFLVPYFHLTNPLKSILLNCM